MLILGLARLGRSCWWSQLRSYLCRAATDKSQQLLILGNFTIRTSYVKRPPSDDRYGELTSAALSPVLDDGLSHIVLLTF